MRCFGGYQPIKIIPHPVNNQNNKKIEAIFDDHETATKSVDNLKNNNFDVVFKKSPRMTLVKDNHLAKPLGLKPIESGQHFEHDLGKKPHLKNIESTSTVGGDGDDGGFGTIKYRPYRPGNVPSNDVDNDESFEWTEESDGDEDEESDDAEWALEQGFSGSSDDEQSNNNQPINDDKNNSIL